MMNALLHCSRLWLIYAGGYTQQLATADRSAKNDEFIFIRE